jgi:acrylyl-CoA reductase (NADPH)
VTIAACGLADWVIRMATSDTFPCLIVRRDEAGKVSTAVEQLTLADLPLGDMVIDVAYSSINYKDALACRAQSGIVRKLPHIPGIDCAGTVQESSDPRYAKGDQVLVTGYDLGAPAWGGYSQKVRVPADWVVPLPKALSAREAMTYGTAGFTAAQCVMAIRQRGIEPARGEVVVTGATGGVGSVAIAILAKLGYQVVAVSGKPEYAGVLKELGAARVIPREEVNDHSDTPMLSGKWSAAVDTVGGNTLATLIRGLDHRGCVTACGLVGGADLPLTVYPFILRGVALLGIDSAKCPRAPRLEVWQKLSGEWNVSDKLAPLAREVTLSQVPHEVDLMLAGKNHGRILVRPVA